MYFDSSFFVAVAFGLFILLLGYFGAHTLIANTLDNRGKRIQAELDEARKLREEAEAVLASYKARAAQAQADADAIVAQAREEAEAMARESAARMEEFVARRTRQAEAKIAVAETQAANEVRAAAADAAVIAAEKVLRIQTKGAAADELIARGIDDVRKQLAH